MMNWKFYIFILIAPFVVVSCYDDFEQEPRDVTFCVRAAWHDGINVGNATRALSATDILSPGTGDIEIHTVDYPNTVNVHCSDDNDFTLTKGSALCADHNTFWQYTPSVIYKDKKIERDNLTFTATATIDEGDDLEGEATFANLHDNHLQFTLHHTKSLLRFAFKVSDKYNKVRYIKVTGINLNGSDCIVVDKLLTKDSQFIAYAYVDPSVVTTSNNNTIECTYNIYDKDDATNAHLTREGVVATNTFNPVYTIEAGYYYDLKVTLNPDYLYVLSEHDNKHITIN